MGLNNLRELVDGESAVSSFGIDPAIGGCDGGIDGKEPRVGGLEPQGRGLIKSGESVDGMGELELMVAKLGPEGIETRKDEGLVGSSVLGESRREYALAVD